jgi:hypothetical protein
MAIPGLTAARCHDRCDRYHPNEEIHQLVAGYACAGFHPWPCMPRRCERPIAEWTIPQFVGFMADECGTIAASAIRITVN